MDDDIAVDFTKLIPKALNELSKNLYAIAGWIHSNMKVRRQKSKWSLTEKEFINEIFPDFVSGWAYGITWNTAQILVNEAMEIQKPLWIDDVWFTGILRSKGLNN